MKTLKDILEVYQAKSKDERRFVDKHIVVKQKDRNGNKDDVFQATNIKPLDRKKERHGYEPGEDEKVYEETEQLDEEENQVLSRLGQTTASERGDHLGERGDVSEERVGSLNAARGAAGAGPGECRRGRARGQGTHCSDHVFDGALWQCVGLQRFGGTAVS